MATDIFNAPWRFVHRRMAGVLLAVFILLLIHIATRELYLAP